MEPGPDTGLLENGDLQVKKAHDRQAAGIDFRVFEYLAAISGTDGLGVYGRLGRTIVELKLGDGKRGGSMREILRYISQWVGSHRTVRRMIVREIDSRRMGEGCDRRGRSVARIIEIQMRDRERRD